MVLSYVFTLMSAESQELIASMVSNTRPDASVDQMSVAEVFEDGSLASYFHEFLCSITAV